jgi:hypothetical protein
MLNTFSTYECDMVIDGKEQREQSTSSATSRNRNSQSNRHFVLPSTLILLLYKYRFYAKESETDLTDLTDCLYVNRQNTCTRGARTVRSCWSGREPKSRRKLKRASNACIIAHLSGVGVVYRIEPSSSKGDTKSPRKSAAAAPLILSAVVFSL